MPFNAEVHYDRAKRERLVANLDARFSKRRTGIHVSDLTMCLRQAVFRRLVPKPLTERDLSFFTAGRGYHDLLEHIYEAEREVHREWQGIHATFDLLDGHIPLELKSSRSFWRTVQPHWVRQLGYYCAIENVTVGGLIVLWLFPNRLAREDGMIESYSVEFPNIEQIRQDLQQRRDLLVKALESQDVMVAPYITEPSDRWLCNNCPYRSECGR
jgi:CRISPR/Cas system-associated exonuclease Cas4 (RecB family)